MQSIDNWGLDSVSDTAHIIVITDIYSGVFHTFWIFFISKYLLTLIS